MNMGLKVENINDLLMLIHLSDIQLDTADFQKKNLFLEMFLVLNSQFLTSSKTAHTGGNHYFLFSIPKVLKAYVSYLISK